MTIDIWLKLDNVFVLIYFNDWYSHILEVASLYSVISLVNPFLQLDDLILFPNLQIPNLI